jgi:hypothetical protein
MVFEIRERDGNGHGEPARVGQQLVFTRTLCGPGLSRRKLAAASQTSGSRNAVWLFRYHDLGSATSPMIAPRPPPGSCIPAGSRGSPIGSLAGCQRSPLPSHTQPHRAS